jgi:hypothetical protein
VSSSSKTWSTYSEATEDDDGTKRTVGDSCIALAYGLLYGIAADTHESLTHKLYDLGYLQDDVGPTDDAEWEFENNV